MVFSSYLFLFWFLPLALAVYFAVPRRLKNLVLTAFSYVFYGWANPYFGLLMLGSTLVDFFCGLTIESDRDQGNSDVLGHPNGTKAKVALGVSLVTNLSLLAFFKYFNFATDSLSGLVNLLGLEASLVAPSFQVVLPLGISFYTFQSMSYSIDVYRRDARAIRNPIDFACYVSMFPQLVAGPIVRFKEIEKQIVGRTHCISKIAYGIAFFTVGLGKKVLLANPCGRIADLVFDTAGAGTLDAWLGMIAYAYQIYFDFSGYSDMAVGLGLAFGFTLPKNFASPYQSSSITEFWRRWHISLSAWLRDYLYIPLGGSRRGWARNYFNLFAVMLLGGLWHGASWNFVVWGGLHGLLLCWDRFRRRFQLKFGLPHFLQVGLTFAVVVLTWVPFRADSLAQTMEMYGALFGLSTTNPSSVLLSGLVQTPVHLTLLFGCSGLVWFAKDSWSQLASISPWKASLLVILLFLTLVMMLTQSYSPFIYFIF